MEIKGKASVFNAFFQCLSCSLDSAASIFTLASTTLILFSLVIVISVYVTMFTFESTAVDYLFH
jgi:hypothetical protein